MNEGIKQYLSKNDKFAVRMSVALRRKDLKQTSRTFVKTTKSFDADQNELFENKDKVNLLGNNKVTENYVDLDNHAEHKRC